MNVNQSMMECEKKIYWLCMLKFFLKEEWNDSIFAVFFKDENLQLVNHEASSMAVDVVPHVDNPTFEEDESPDKETAVREIKT